jgi:hypothetical protein
MSRTLGRRCKENRESVSQHRQLKVLLMHQADDIQADGTHLIVILCAEFMSANLSQEPSSQGQAKDSRELM